jgi:hypothetical protein
MFSTSPYTYLAEPYHPATTMLSMVSPFDGAFTYDFAIVQNAPDVLIQEICFANTE